MDNNDITSKPAPSTVPDKHPGGRPTTYDQRYAIAAHKLALLGCNDERIAEILNIPNSSFSEWKNSQPELLEALQDGRGTADGKVASALYNLALSGNVTAMIFWLKNRQKEYWRDKQDIVVSGNVSLTALSEQDIDAELQAIRARIGEIIDVTPEPKQIEDKT